jgi:hypothetical protein
MRETQIQPKDKWCPMARLAMIAHGPECAPNRFPGGVKWHDDWLAVRCLGEACAVFVGTDVDGHCGMIRR